VFVPITTAMRVVANSEIDVIVNEYMGDSGPDLPTTPVPA